MVLRASREPKDAKEQSAFGAILETQAKGEDRVSQVIEAGQALQVGQVLQDHVDKRDGPDFQDSLDEMAGLASVSRVYLEHKDYRDTQGHWDLRVNLDHPAGLVALECKALAKLVILVQLA